MAGCRNQLAHSLPLRTKLKPALLALVAFAFAFTCLPGRSAFAVQATVSWDAETLPTLAGYKVHYGTASGDYAVHLDVGKVNSQVIDGLSPETSYHFAVTAYDLFEGESGYSTEVVYTTAPDLEIVSAPSVPLGPQSGVTGTAYAYTASGAASSTGDPIQYRFHWGDGTVSGWIATEPATAWKSWDLPGSYSIQVEAACALHPSVNAYSPESVVGILQRDPLLFSDDFSDGGASVDPQWKSVAGKWTVSGFKMILVSPARSKSAFLVRSLPAFASGRLRSRFWLTNTYAAAPSAGLLFAYRGGGSYRYVTLFKDKVVIGQVGSTAAEPAGKKRTAAVRLRTGTWYQVRMDLRPNGTVSVYLNRSAMPVVSYRFKDVVPGGVGYLCQKAKAYYDDYFVWDKTILP